MTIAVEATWWLIRNLLLNISFLCKDEFVTDIKNITVGSETLELRI